MSTVEMVQTKVGMHQQFLLVVLTEAVVVALLENSLRSFDAGAFKLNQTPQGQPASTLFDIATRLLSQQSRRDAGSFVSHHCFVDANLIECAKRSADVSYFPLAVAHTTHTLPNPTTHRQSSAHLLSRVICRVMSSSRPDYRHSPVVTHPARAQIKMLQYIIT